MHRQGFIAQSSDLIIMLVAGGATHLWQVSSFSMSVQHQFLVILFFSLIAGLFLNSLSQSLEWALFFLLGIHLVVALPYLMNYLTHGQISLVHLIQTNLLHGKYSLFFISSWIIGIPMGYLSQKAFMHNYYRRSHF